MKAKDLIVPLQEYLTPDTAMREAFTTPMSAEAAVTSFRGKQQQGGLNL
jgi:hypothetical protein